MASLAITIAFLLELPLSYAVRRMSLSLSPSFALIVVGGCRRCPPFMGGEEEEEGAGRVVPLRRCQHSRFPPLIDGRSEVICSPPNAPIAAPCVPTLRHKDGGNRLQIKARTHKFLFVVTVVTSTH